MLTGLITPTTGTAQVGGYQITNEIEDVHLLLGGFLFQKITLYNKYKMYFFY